MDLDAEVLRCRERLHKLESSVSGLEIILSHLRKETEHVSTAIERMVRADEIAAAVEKRLESARRVRFTTAQRSFAILALAVGIADTLSNIFR